jgi:hypothetical protein
MNSVQIRLVVEYNHDGDAVLSVGDYYFAKQERK